MEHNLELAHFVFLCIFTVEMALKIVGLGWKGYIRDKFNAFDAVIVGSDILEAAMEPPSFLVSTHSALESGGVSILRAFRLFRVFRLARRWKSLRVLLSMIGRAFASIGNFGVLLFLFIYIFALLGMQVRTRRRLTTTARYRSSNVFENFSATQCASTTKDTLHRPPSMGFGAERYVRALFSS